ncbi:uncharacterized protein SOCE26_002520 [Sorangium cellulosum]|uniref:Uncharacterized protein n=1 Tax=Sorangium cellulosum TaxID=56 RepID=A0A2L0EHU8_SORCE|nr:uncharacterized protein SOCE26_002520 [Sorangium cellulosum]
MPRLHPFGPSDPEASGAGAPGRTAQRASTHLCERAPVQARARQYVSEGVVQPRPKAPMAPPSTTV